MTAAVDLPGWIDAVSWLVVAAVLGLVLWVIVEAVRDANSPQMDGDAQRRAWEGVVAMDGYSFSPAPAPRITREEALARVERFQEEYPAFQVWAAKVKAESVYLIDWQTDPVIGKDLR